MAVEFHCHTLFSIDGTGTPEALVDAAAARGVTALAITEHNHLGSARRAQLRAEACGIRYFPGIEIDAFLGEYSYHFVGLGVDAERAELYSLAARNHACYGFRFELLHRELLAMGFPWGREEIMAALPERYPTHPSPVLNSYLIDYVVEKKNGPADYRAMKKEAARRVAAQSDHHLPGPDAPGRFCRFEEARDAVHAAGGVILLAHPGKLHRDRPEKQLVLIRMAIEAGADGFELYHHSHFDPPRVEAFAALGREMNCIVSGGSDCHYAPGVAPKDLGGCRAPDELADRLAEALAHRRRKEATPK